MHRETLSFSSMNAWHCVRTISLEASLAAALPTCITPTGRTWSCSHISAVLWSSRMAWKEGATRMRKPFQALDFPCWPNNTPTKPGVLMAQVWKVVTALFTAEIEVWRNGAVGGISGDKYLPRMLSKEAKSLELGPSLGRSVEMSFVPDLSARLIACINTWNLRARTDIYIYMCVTVYIYIYIYTHTLQELGVYENITCTNALYINMDEKP